MVCVIPFPPAAKKKHRRWRCHNTPCVVPTLVLPTSGTDGRRRFPATLSAWLPKLPRRHSRVCMSRTHMTRKSKGEIVLLSAAGMSRKSLALGHLSYYHIRSCHPYPSVSEGPHACHAHPDAETALSSAAAAGRLGMLHREVAVPVGQWWNLC